MTELRRTAGGEYLAAREPAGGPAGARERGAYGADVYGAVRGVWDAAGVDLERDDCGVREVRDDGKELQRRC